MFFCPRSPRRMASIDWERFLIYMRVGRGTIANILISPGGIPGYRHQHPSIELGIARKQRGPFRFRAVWRKSGQAQGRRGLPPVQRFAPGFDDQGISEIPLQLLYLAATLGMPGPAHTQEATEPRLVQWMVSPRARTGSLRAKA